MESMELDTEIFAEISGKNLPVKNISEMRISENDVLIYHMSTGSELNFRIDKFPCRKIMIHHNITPPDFFRPYNRELFALTSYGYTGLEHLNSTFNLCIADSEYNKNQLTEYGYDCNIKVCPVLINFNKYKCVPDISVMKRYFDNYTNIIFVGRIAPNKRHEDIIKSFHVYKKINPQSRLILIGSWSGTEIYYERLKKYVGTLGVDDVIFTGHVKFSEIVAYYRIADVFLCMSRHEGFCVPLLESMFFNVPVIAINAGAVPETLGNSGIIIPDNNPIRTADTIHEIVTNQNLRRNVVRSQRIRLRDFSYGKVSGILKNLLTDFLKGEYI